MDFLGGLSDEFPYMREDGYMADTGVYLGPCITKGGQLNNS